MPQDTQIVRAAIHPGIGVARVGNSPDEFFIGPEVPDAPAKPVGFYKDASGALKRQAARFCLYGYNAAGEVVAEIDPTAAGVEVEWQVELANVKAAWYQFNWAMDIPAAIPSRRRNGNYQGEEREGLKIQPGPRRISGSSQPGGTGGTSKHTFDSGTFLGEKVYLGELRTDEKGRLLVLGGRGKAGTGPGAVAKHNTVVNFGNNDGWWDDVSDGPVEAKVVLDGQEIPVDPAWVVVTPPNYAPDIIPIVTMYDVMYDTYSNTDYGFNNFLPRKERISFTDDIFPILSRLTQTQWVNRGFATEFGFGGPYDFFEEPFLHRLASKDETWKELRRRVFESFRPVPVETVVWWQWPWQYGDAPSVDDPGLDGLLTVTATQYRYLKRWFEGEFEADFDPARQPPAKIGEVPLADQPTTLDKAAMWYCLGGPFHPGIEITWPMRFYTLYSAPFRVRRRPPGSPVPDYGEFLRPDLFQGQNYKVYDEYAPIFEQSPGDLTRWMGIPWHTDLASCRSGYDREFDPYVPALWPSRSLNQVLTTEQWNAVQDPNLPVEERTKIFSRRASWFRGLQGPYVAQMNQLIRDYGKLGVVERREWQSDHPELLPSVAYVESEEELNQGAPPDRNLYNDPPQTLMSNPRQTPRLRGSGS